MGESDRLPKNTAMDAMRITKMKNDNLKCTQRQPFTEKNHAHQVKGQYVGVWECHIKPDWLLLWHVKNDELTLILLDTGSHSDLFK